MPVKYIKESTVPPFLFNGHLQTLYPRFFREVEMDYRRERIETSDNDFLDLDWAEQGSNKLVIISHGLEGSTDRYYIKGMVRALKLHNYDVLAWNNRGCSGEPNRNLYSYHIGFTEDLRMLVDYCLQLGKYEEICLVGFSMGGNITLKYLGEEGGNVSPILSKAVAISTPCHLSTSSQKMIRWNNFLYNYNFTSQLKNIVRMKHAMFPGQVNLKPLEKIKNVRQFDEHYTAPINGFKNAEDFYEKSSSLHYLDGIIVPTLILNARNDSFLSKESFPIEQAQRMPNLFLEISEDGGHVGFCKADENDLYWSEKRTLEFLS